MLMVFLLVGVLHLGLAHLHHIEFYFVIRHRSLWSGTRESVAHVSNQLCTPCVKGRLCFLRYLEVIIKIPPECDREETNHQIIGILYNITFPRQATVLCKSNANEIRRKSSIVLVNFP